MNADDREAPHAADQIASALQRHPPKLDDLARARLASMLGALPPPAATGDAAESPSTSRLSARRWRAGVAAVATLAAAGALWWRATSAERWQPAPVSTHQRSPASPPDAAGTVPPQAQRRLVQLEDVSLTLLGDARAQVNTTSSSTEITLTHGTIELEAKGRGRSPVVTVRAGELRITAAQARFAASVQGSRVQVRASYGEVLVRAASQTTTEVVTAPATREYELAPSDLGRKAQLTGAPETRTTQTKLAPSLPQVEAQAQAATATGATSSDLPAGTETAPAPPRISPPPTPTPPPTDDAASLERTYQEAEAAIASGDLSSGMRLLQAMVQRAPRDRRADAARFDLARLADRTGDVQAARRWLGEVLASGRDEIVREPAHLMLCRVLMREQDVGATECLRQFRREFPRSARDGEILAQLATREHASAGCAAALPLIEEYLRRYATGTFAGKLRATRAACGERPL
jgi:TolA-binding protein